MLQIMYIGMLWCIIVVSNTSLVAGTVYTAEANQNRPSGKVWRENNHTWSLWSITRKLQPLRNQMRLCV